MPSAPRMKKGQGLPASARARETLKLYFDYKSPFAYLAAEPAFALA